MTSPYSFPQNFNHSKVQYLLSTPKPPKPPIHNPYDKFTQLEFDSWIGGITGALKRALGQEEIEHPVNSQEAYYDPAVDVSGVELSDDNESMGEVDDSFADLKARRVLGKGKARDPREGPGFGTGERHQPIEIGSESEEEEYEVEESGEEVSETSSQEGDDNDDEIQERNLGESSVQVEVHHPRNDHDPMSEYEDESQSDSLGSGGEDNEVRILVPSHRKDHSDDDSLSVDEDISIYESEPDEDPLTLTSTSRHHTTIEESDVVYDVDLEELEDGNFSDAEEAYDVDQEKKFKDTNIQIYEGQGDKDHIPSLPRGSPEFEYEGDDIPHNTERGVFYASHDRDLVDEHADVTENLHKQDTRAEFSIVNVKHPIIADGVEESLEPSHPDVIQPQVYEIDEDDGNVEDAVVLHDQQDRETATPPLVTSTPQPSNDQHRLNSVDISEVNGQNSEGVQSVTMGTTLPQQAPHVVVDVDIPVDIPDVWTGPKTYAEDFYSGGDARPETDAQSGAHHIGATDEGSNTSKLESIATNGTTALGSLNGNMLDASTLGDEAQKIEDIPTGESPLPSSLELLHSQNDHLTEELDFDVLYGDMEVENFSPFTEQPESSWKHLPTGSSDEVTTNVYDHHISHDTDIAAQTQSNSALGINENVLYFGQTDLVKERQPDDVDEDVDIMSEEIKIHRTTETQEVVEVAEIRESVKVETKDHGGEYKWLELEGSVEDVKLAGGLIQPQGQTVPQVPITTQIQPHEATEALEHVPHQDIGIAKDIMTTHVDQGLETSNGSPLTQVEALSSGLVSHSHSTAVHPQLQPGQQTEVNPQQQTAQALPFEQDFKGHPEHTLEASSADHPNLNNDSLVSPPISNLMHAHAPTEHKKPSEVIDRESSVYDIIIDEDADGEADLNLNETQCTPSETIKTRADIGAFTSPVKPTALVKDEHSSLNALAAEQVPEQPITPTHELPLPELLAAEPGREFANTYGKGLPPKTDSSPTPEVPMPVYANPSVPLPSLNPDTSSAPDALSVPDSLPPHQPPPFAHPMRVVMRKSTDPVLFSDPYPYSLSTPGDFGDTPRDASDEPSEEDTEQDYSLSSSSTFDKDGEDKHIIGGMGDEPDLDASDMELRYPSEPPQDTKVLAEDVAAAVVAPPELGDIYNDTDADGDLDPDFAQTHDDPFMVTHPKPESIKESVVSPQKSVTPAMVAERTLSTAPADELPSILIVKPKPPPVQIVYDDDSEELTDLEDSPPSNPKPSHLPKRKRSQSLQRSPLERNSSQNGHGSPITRSMSSKESERSKLSSAKSVANRSSFKKNSRVTSWTTKGKKKETNGRQPSEKPSESSRSSASSSSKKFRLDNISISRESSIISNTPSDKSSVTVLPSPTLSKNRPPPPPPLMHTHSHTIRHHHHLPSAAQPLQVQPQVRKTLSLESQSTGMSTAKPTPAPQPQHPIHKATGFSSSPVTRSNCRYHKISIPQEENEVDGPHVYFLIPGCSLGDRELIEEEDIVDHGDATHEDSLRMVTDMEAWGVHPYLIGVLRQLAGKDLARQQDFYYLPPPGQEPPPKVKSEKPALGKLSRSALDNSSTHGSPRTPTVPNSSPTSKAPVSTSTASSASTVDFAKWGSKRSRASDAHGEDKHRKQKKPKFRQD